MRRYNDRMNRYARIDDKEKLRMAKNLVKSNNKKIKKALELINDFEPLEMYRGEEDPETSERLVKEIKEILEK